jgi:hypothetical protein
VVGEGYTKYYYCRSCPSGKVNHEPSMNDCVTNPVIIPPSTPSCAAVQYPTYSTNCVCDKAQYRRWSPSWSPNKWVCEGCPGGKFQPYVSNTEECMTCVRGKFSMWGATECTDCAAGKISSLEGAQLCSTLCLPGTYAQGTGNFQCEACARGKYTEYQIGTVVPASGASECFTNQQFCRNNNYCNNDAVVNSACTCCSGQFMIVSNGIRRCEMCPGGKYMDANSHQETACKTCVAGKYPTALSFTDTASAQVPVDFGLQGHGSIECVGAVAATKCKKCPVGTYKSKTGYYLCETCLPGHFMASTGASECDKCVPGSYSNSFVSDGSRCQKCSPGSSSIEGAASCYMCEEGKAASVAGSLCIECGAGKYALP